MGKVKKGINFGKIAKGLHRGLIALDAAGKKEADWFFGMDVKRAAEPEREMMVGWDREADEFFGFGKRKKPTAKREVIIIRG